MSGRSASAAGGAPRAAATVNSYRWLPRARWAFAMSFVVGVVGALRGDMWMYFVMLFALAATGVNSLPLPLAPLDLELVVPDTEVVGAPTPAQLRVRARSRIRRQRVAVIAAGDALDWKRPPSEVGAQGVIEAMGPGESQVIDLELHPDARGIHTGVLVRRWTEAPFGFVRRTAVTSLPRSRMIGVEPTDTVSRAVARPGQGGDPHVRIGRDGDDVHALRSWTTGDGSAVHWRSTARRGSPVVVDRERPDARGLVIVAGPASTASGADAVVAGAAGLARAAVRDGAHVDLVSSSGVTTLTSYDDAALETWTVHAGPAAADAETAGLTAALAGSGGRVAVVHGRGGHSEVWAPAAQATGVEVLDFVIEDRAPWPPVEPVVTGIEPSLALAAVVSMVGGLLAVLLTGALSGAVATAASLLLVAALAVAMLRPLVELSARARSVLSVAALWLTCALTVYVVNVSGAEPAPSATVAVCGVGLGAAVAARTRRDALLVLGLGPLLVLVAAGLAPGPALVLPAVVVALAVLLGLAWSAEASLSDGVRSAVGTPSPRALVPAIATVVIAVATFLVMPLGNGSALTTSLLGDREPAPPAPAQVAESQVPSYFGGALDLSARGHLPSSVALEVPLDSPGLLRAMTLEQSIGDTWSTQPQQQALRATSGRITLPSDPADSGAPAGAVRDLAVRPSGTSSVVAPGTPRSVTGVDAVWQEQPNGFVITGALVPYTVSAVPVPDIDSLTATGTGADRTEPDYLTPDPTTTVRTQQLAQQITAGITDRVAAVHAIEEWLRANVRYQLDAPLPPSQQNAVDFLLFDSHAGFCEHFAAAEATMLRTLGIPSRLATGYSASGGDVTADGWRVVRESDAHAWVEVWIPGHGWVSSDPTAGSTLAEDRSASSLLRKVSDWWSSTWASDAGRRALAIGVLLLGGACVLVIVAVRRRRAAARARHDEAVLRSLSEPLAAFARYRAASSSSRGRTPEPGDGVGEVRRSAPDDAALQRALDVVELTLYGRRPPAPEERLAAAGVLDEHAARLLADSESSDSRSVPV